MITAASAVIVLGILPFGGGMAADAAVTAGNTVVYDATVSPLPGNLPSLGFQATQTAEFGDLVQLAGSDRVLRSATITLSDWAKHSDYLDLPAPGWTHPITFNVYGVNRSNDPAVPPALGPQIGSVTQTVAIPWYQKRKEGKELKKIVCICTERHMKIKIKSCKIKNQQRKRSKIIQLNSIL